MSALSQRLADARFKAEFDARNQSKYSQPGAEFQEWALGLNLDGHQSAVVGRYVTAINNGRCTVAEAKAEIRALLHISNY